MSDQISMASRSAPRSASTTRQGVQVLLVVVHSDPRSVADALSAYTAEGATTAPHYHIAADGMVTALVDEARAARHSGRATWQRRVRNIDRLSVGVAVEHTPGSVLAPAALAVLRTLVGQIQARYHLTADSLVHWEAADQARSSAAGALVPLTLPPSSALVRFVETAAFSPGFSFDVGATAAEEEVACVPPSPPAASEPPTPQQEGVVSFAVPTDPAASLRLWDFIAQESYRQRGEGFKSNWAFHRFAPKNNLGAPIARASDGTNQVTFNGKTYGFQVFGRDTVFNEIPQWTAVQSMSALLNGAIPASGVGRLLLEATHKVTGNVLHPDWKFHQIAVAQRLGPPLSASYTLAIAGQQVNLQVFAGDTLYTFPPNWGDVRRLSETPAGPLAAGLWLETYKPSGAPYNAAAPFHLIALREKLGAPLSAPYAIDYEGNSYTVQVFVGDTIFAGPDGVPILFSALVKPDVVKNFVPAQPAPTPPPDAGAAAPTSAGSPDDALSNKTPVFTMIPVAGQPGISQFYGYTKYSRQKAQEIYSQTQGRHSGLDFSVPEGTPLLAIAHGVVLCAGQGCPFGANKPGSIVVRYGAVYALYGHASAVKVTKGQLIRPGDVIGLSGTFVGAHLHFELRPVPAQVINNRDPNQNPVNPGVALNPIKYFAPELMGYFEQQYGRLRGTVGEFCVGSLHDQPDTTFGGPIDTRPCTN